MKTLATFLAMCSVTFGNPAAVALHNGATVIRDNFGNQIALTPFASPIGVPVATVQPGGTMYAQGSSSDISALVAEIRALRAEVQAMKGGAVAQSKTTAISATCASCHAQGSTNARSELAREHFKLESLSTWQGREKAQDAILNDRMPPGRPLDGATAGNVLREIVGIGKAQAKAQEAPPVPPSAEPEP